MSIFKEPHSRNPNQLQFDARPLYQKLGLGIGGLVFGLIVLPLSFYAFLTSLLPLAAMFTGEDIVNINYVGFFCGAGIFMSHMLFLGAYTTLVHKRVVIPSEMTDWHKNAFFFFFKTAIFFFAIIGPLLSITSIVLVQVYDYSWCPQLSQGSGWDSWWVIDPQLCKSPN